MSNPNKWLGKMELWAMVLAAKANNDLCSIPGTHMVETDN